jgi:hypothetical protein
MPIKIFGTQQEVGTGTVPDNLIRYQNNLEYTHISNPAKWYFEMHLLHFPRNDLLEIPF